MRSIVLKLKRKMRRNRLDGGIWNRILIVNGVLLLMILFSTITYAATSIELTTGNFINVFGNLNLSGNNLVNAGNVSIKGNLSVDGNVSVDGSTFFVDATGDRVGIGTTNPREELQVNTNGPAATLIFNEETDSRPGSTIIGEVVFAGDTTSGSSYRNFTKIDTGITDDSTATYTGFMRFLTSNSGTLAERMRITGAGNVGIGTTNPTSGTGVGRVLEISGGDSGLSLNSTTAGVRWSIDSQTSGKLFISQGSTARMVVENNTGNVGIGTTSPLDKLHIDGDILVNDTSNDARLRLFGSGSGKEWVIGAGSSGGGSNGDLYIQHAGIVTAITIQNTTGNVGIGQTTPTEKLQVGGTIHIRHTADQILRFTEENIAARWAIGVPATGSGAQTGADLVFRGNGAINLTAPEGTEYMRITSTGNVGIGTTGPAATLHSNGTFIHSSVTNSATAFQVQNASGTTLLDVDTINQRVGIGTTAPEAKVQIQNAAAASISALRIEESSPATTGDVLKLEFFGDGPGDSTIRELARIQAHNIQTGSHHGYLSFWTMQSTTIGERMRIDDGGNVGIGATVPGSRLEVENTGSANDVLLLEDSSGLCEAQPTTTDLTWSCSSDEKLKTNIKPSRFNALAYVTGIPLFDYTVKKTEENATGWTAQAMLKNPLYADLVTNRTYFNPETNQTESELSVSTLPQSTLIKAIQEQQEQITELKTGKPKEAQQPSIESGYQKINGSIILTLG